jgi:hypothetical protein
MATNKAIRYSVREIKRSEKGFFGADDARVFCAKVNNLSVINREELVNLMAGKNTTVTRHDIGVVLDIFDEVVREELVRGNVVNTGLFRASAAIRGRFDSFADEYDASRHSIEVTMSAGSKLRKRIAFEATTDKIVSSTRVPKIVGVYDYRSKTSNETVSAGYTAEITGANLNVTSENPDQGVYFVNEITNEQTAVDSINRITDTRIVFTVPETLSGGDYSILVRRVSGDETLDVGNAAKIKVVAVTAN